jgi:hypothetical protein
MNVRTRVVEALLLLVAIAVVARVLFGLLGPLLPPLLVLVMITSLFLFVLRRQ